MNAGQLGAVAEKVAELEWQGEAIEDRTCASCPLPRFSFSLSQHFGVLNMLLFRRLPEKMLMNLE